MPTFNITLLYISSDKQKYPHRGLGGWHCPTPVVPCHTTLWGKALHFSLNTTWATSLGSPAAVVSGRMGTQTQQQLAWKDLKRASSSRHQAFLSPCRARMRCCCALSHPPGWNSPAWGMLRIRSTEQSLPSLSSAIIHLLSSTFVTPQLSVASWPCFWWSLTFLKSLVLLAQPIKQQG